MMTKQSDIDYLQTFVSKLVNMLNHDKKLSLLVSNLKKAALNRNQKYYRVNFVQAELFTGNPIQAKAWGLKHQPWDEGNDDADWYITFEDIEPLPKNQCYLIRENDVVNYCSIEYFNEHYRKI